MEVDRLKKDELLYELRCRGFVKSPADDFSELRDLLRSVLKREKDGELFDEPPLDPDEELMLCDAKLDEVRHDLDCPAVVAPRRVRSLLFHLNSRLMRCLTYCTDNKLEHRERCKRLMKELKAISNSFKELGSTADYKAPSVISVSTCRESVSQRVPHSAPSLRSYHSATNRESLVEDRPLLRHPLGMMSDDMHSLHLEEPSHPQGCVSFPFSNPATFGGGGQAGYHPAPFNTIPRAQPFADVPFQPRREVKHRLHEWNLTYSGSKESSLNSFLIRLEELAESRGVPFTELFYGATEFFTGTALIWYRSVRNQVSSWDELKAYLRREFLPPDYEIALWEEIRARKQGREESVQSFVSCMLGLFERLSEPVSEQAKLDQIMRNLAPWYIENLPLETIISISHLKEAARVLEVKKSLIDRYNNVAKSSLLEPDLACRAPVSKRPAIHEVEAVPSSSASSSIPEATPKETPKVEVLSSGFKCWNCGNTDHGFRDCTAKKNLFCHKCGHPKVLTKDCPKCSKKSGN
ncbi:hypothetical protein FOCC_FOCC004780 [Frankliniella occidentalis]|nr:hypothetical protein FOCC_FOCC004780 [Frankliniella occidentalis]